MVTLFDYTINAGEANEFFRGNRLCKLICFSCFIICFCLFGTVITFAYTDTDISNQYVGETHTVEIVTNSFDMNVDNYRWMVKAKLVDGTDVIK